MYTAESDLAVEEISELNQIETLRAEWASLWSRAAKTSPFQSAEWLLSWAKHVSFGRPWVVAIRSGTRLVGLAPFCIQEMDAGEGRHIYLLGTGISDYLDVLVEPGYENTLAAIVFNRLNEHAGHWHACDFQQLRPESPLLTRDFGPTCRDSVEVQEFCPLLRYQGNQWLIPEEFLEKLKYEERRLNREGKVSFTAATAETFEKDFDVFLRLHGARWGTRGQTGVLSDTTIQRFHIQAAEGLLRRGVLRLYSLRLDGRPVASYYGFLHQRRAYYYLSGFDPEYERLSVGNQMVWHALREAERENATTFDFLRGQEAYKYRWGAQDRPTYRRRLSRRSDQ